MWDSLRVSVRWTCPRVQAVFDPAAALASRGIETCACSFDACGGICVVPFINVNGELLELVHSLADCNDQVVCVCVAPQALGDSRLGPAWELLDAGAADVLVADGATEITEQIVGRIERFRETEAAIDDPWGAKTLLGQERCLETSAASRGRRLAAGQRVRAGNGRDRHW